MGKSGRTQLLNLRLVLPASSSSPRLGWRLPPAMLLTRDFH